MSKALGEVDHAPGVAARLEVEARERAPRRVVAEEGVGDEASARRG